MTEMPQNHFAGKENLLLAALEFADAGIAIIDQNGTLAYVNPKYAGINGYKQEELMGQSLSILVDSTEPVPLETVLEAFAKLDSKASGERKVKRRDNSTVDVHFTIEKVVIEGVPYTLATLQDITALHGVRKELSHKQDLIRESERRNDETRQLIMNAALDAIICVNQDGEIDFWNPQAENIFGWSAAEAIGRPMISLIIPEGKREIHENELAEYLRTGYGPTFNVLLELEAIRRDGSIFPIEICVLPIEQENKKFFCAFIRDISERKRTEAIQRELNRHLSRNLDQLGKSNLELEQFAYIASHDLQEPLRMVTGFLTQLDKNYRELLDEKGREYLYFAVDGAVRMRQIIIDLLEYSRADNVDAPLEPVDLNRVVDEIATLNREILTESNGSLTRSALPVVSARRIPITQVFQNLIGNAIKYRRPDSPPVIEISCNDQGDHWLFKVTDNGIGIPVKHFEKIFVVFQRLHLREQFSGTGVGLAICKKIIESYGGRIWVESEPEKGSTFYFTIRK